jgi:hypothetical protein
MNIDKKNLKNLHTNLNLVDTLLIVASTLSPYIGNYRTPTSFTSIVNDKLKQLDLYSKCIVSRNTFINYFVDSDNNGCGTYGTPRRVYSEKYDNFLEEENFTYLLNINIKIQQEKSGLKYNDSYENNKVISKVCKLLSSELGKEKTLKFSLNLLNAHSDGYYDRHLTIRDFFLKQLESSFPPEFKNQINDYFSRKPSDTDFKKLMDQMSDGDFSGFDNNIKKTNKTDVSKKIYFQDEIKF